MAVKIKTHFFIGTGGVGKTTLASLFALKLSKEKPDAKVKLVTIDPSNRLKTYFEMSGKETSKEIGNLSVFLNDRSTLLKKFVTESAQKQDIDPEIIFSNKLFQTLMGGLAVSQEFSSLYELHESHNSKEFDFVVIDTPPLQNSSDFLSSADLLTEFFSSALAKFFLSQDERGLLYKMVNSARRTSLKVLASLTGSDFVEELSFFFKVVEFLREDLLQTLSESREILMKQAEVVVVCNANELSLCGIAVALKNFKGEGLNLTKCVLNKYDVEDLNSATFDRIKNLKKDFKKLAYIEVSKFKSEPSEYSDLLENIKNVNL